MQSVKTIFVVFVKPVFYITNYICVLKIGLSNFIFMNDFIEIHKTDFVTRTLSPMFT